MTDFVKDIISDLNKYLPEVTKPVIVQGPPIYDDGSDSYEFYKKSRIYWANLPPTIGSILGGFEEVNHCDIRGSREFLLNLKYLNKGYALDCGAGIGRVTKSLLSPIFKKVDCVEQDFKFVRHMKQALSGQCKNVEFIYNMGLQDFSPEKEKYTLIWCQWVLEYLKEWDLIEFLMRAREGLISGGYLVVKENILSKRTRFNQEDYSYTRTTKKYLSILDRAGFKVISKTQQKDYPKKLCPVLMIACISK